MVDPQFLLIIQFMFMLTYICLGPIFRLHIGSKPVVVVSSQQFVNEACDEKRFHKTLKSVLRVRRYHARKDRGDTE